MERTEVLDMMSGLKLYGMRSAYDETLAMAIKRKHEPQRFVGDLLKAEIQGSRRARSSTSSPAPSCRWRRTSRTSPSRTRRSTKLSCSTWPAEPSSSSSATHLHRGHRHKQDASGHRHRAKLHPIRIARALFHHRRSRQSARGRKPSRTSGTHRRLPDPSRLRHPRRTRLSAFRSGRWTIAIPSRQPAL
jgi:hypothetical protein